MAFSVNATAAAALLLATSFFAVPAVSQQLELRRGDPLNLSILVSGGKETNQDSLSNGE